MKINILTPNKWKRLLLEYLKFGFTNEWNKIGSKIKKIKRFGGRKLFKLEDNFDFLQVLEATN